MKLRVFGRGALVAVVVTATAVPITAASAVPAASVLTSIETDEAPAVIDQGVSEPDSRGGIRVACQGPRSAGSKAPAKKKREVEQAQQLKASLKQAIEDAVRRDHDRATLRIMVHDEGAQVWCGYQQRKSVITRSVTKVAMSMALLRQRDRQHRRASRSELSAIRKAITRSSNSAGQRVFNALGNGVSVMRSFYRTAGMRDAHQPSPKDRWGNVHTSPADQIALLRLLNDGTNKVLKKGDKKLILRHMRSVVKSQRWGISEGAPARASIAIKNGWGPSAAEPGYIVNSIGSVTRGPVRYHLVVMTNHNLSEPAGMRRTGHAAKFVNKVMTKAN